MTKMLTATAPLAALLIAAASAAEAAPAAVSVKVHNPLATARGPETVTVGIAELRKHAPALEATKLVVLDEKRQPVLSQLVDADGDDTPDELVFQATLGAKQDKIFTVETGARQAAPRDAYKVYGRFVRERRTPPTPESVAVACRRGFLPPIVSRHVHHHSAHRGIASARADRCSRAFRNWAIDGLRRSIVCDAHRRIPAGRCGGRAE